MNREPFKMRFDTATIQHLGLQMYSTLPAVLGELVANSWDADATEVRITIPEQKFDDSSKIVVEDNGTGMTDQAIRDAYMIVGRDRREEESTQVTRTKERKVMGRKGIGKFAGFGIAKLIGVETVAGNESSRFEMDYEKLKGIGGREDAEFDLLPGTDLNGGTRITLENIEKFRTRSIDISKTRKSLARRFSVIADDFSVVVNGTLIDIEERDLKQYLDKDGNGDPLIWEYDEEPIDPEDDSLVVSGWVGALQRTSSVSDKIDRGIVIMARGKLVQEPFTFEAVVGQQFALSYLVGEIHAEFVDDEIDTVGTSRSTLVWAQPNNVKLLDWGKKELNNIAREWAERRGATAEKKVMETEQYQKFKARAEEIGNKRLIGKLDGIVKNVIRNTNITPDTSTEDLRGLDKVVEMATDYLEYDHFWEVAEEIGDTTSSEPSRLIQLFSEWEIVEAKEMMKVTEGRINTIERFQELIATEANEVPDVHKFLKDFPWTLDPRWTLVADEVPYSKLLREQFAKPSASVETDRRIDFLCVSEGQALVVVEIKRPGNKASERDLVQIGDYVRYVKTQIEESRDSGKYKAVIGYLLCSGIVHSARNTVLIKELENNGIYIKEYRNLLESVKGLHRAFLEKYQKLREGEKPHQRCDK